MTILFADVRTPSDIECAFATMTRERVDAVLIFGGGLTYSFRRQIADLALQHRLPGASVVREFAKAGSLLS